MAKDTALMTDTETDPAIAPAMATETDTAMAPATEKATATLMALVEDPAQKMEMGKG